MVKIKRVYERPQESDGVRFLVERLWPRGMKKEELIIDSLVKDVAPSTELRRWFGHYPLKWDEFQKRYLAELAGNASAWMPILEAAQKGEVTLLYSAHDTEHNSAIVLKSFLDQRLSK